MFVHYLLFYHKNFDGKLQSMFGVNLLDSKDFSLKVSIAYVHAECVAC